MRSLTATPPNPPPRSSLTVSNTHDTRATPIHSPGAVSREGRSYRTLNRLYTTPPPSPICPALITTPHKHVWWVPSTPTAHRISTHRPIPSPSVNSQRQPRTSPSCTPTPQRASPLRRPKQRYFYSSPSVVSMIPVPNSPRTTFAPFPPL
ncbi:hypothetical protein AA313_de0200808 [Arthrobotrys entomopaga]|nr:hypothetical protein AA313_de0200808 [Arthrobotrys entomopaga]